MIQYACQAVSFRSAVAHDASVSWVFYCISYLENAIFMADVMDAMIEII